MLAGVFEGNFHLERGEIDGHYRMLAGDVVVGQLDVILDREKAYLEWFGVKRPYRRMGYGQRAMRELHAWLTSKGVTELRLHNPTSKSIIDLTIKEFGNKYRCLSWKSCSELYAELPDDPPYWIESMFEDSGYADFPEDFPQVTMLFEIT